MKKTEGKSFTFFTTVKLNSPAYLSAFKPFLCLSSSSPLYLFLLFSSPLASAVLVYLRHTGIKLRDSKVFPSLSAEKEKWLAFLKTKKVGKETLVFKK